MQIKYRAWDNVKDKMYYVGEEDYISFGFESNGIVAYDVTEDEAEFKTLHHLQYMQYIGLKDKNGNEIFVGDVVNTIYDGELFTGIIVYDEFELGFKATNGKENYGSKFQYLPCCEEVEIIGNIYENSELLKGVGA
ncbi:MULTISPECIES: YopX family protein [Bacillus]|uniref:YopX family protein n=1 Tax=Bacillus TaxID=1386 RepID=UPI00209E8C6B|nr:YopX family protein [Bacillus sp. 1663tsa1]MCP1178506.1 YopX family protein [Bacillus sp. 1663tsa1]